MLNSLINYLKDDDDFIRVFEAYNKQQFKNITEALKKFLKQCNLKHYLIEHYYKDINYCVLKNHIYNLNNLFTDFLAYLLEN